MFGVAQYTATCSVLQTLQGMQDDAVGSAAATLLNQLLLHLKADSIKDTGSSPLDIFASDAHSVLALANTTAHALVASLKGLQHLLCNICFAASALPADVSTRHAWSLF